MKDNGVYYRVVLGLTLAAIPVGASAQNDSETAEAGHFYAGGHAGVNEAVDWPVEVDLGAGVLLDGTVGAKANAQGGLQVGYERDHARAEIELLYGSLSAKTFSLGFLSGSDDAIIRYGAVMLNGHRTFDITQRISISFGAGAGLVRTFYPRLETGTSCNCLSQYSRSGFSYQLRAGLEYDLSENLKMTGHYNRMFLPSLESRKSPNTRYESVDFGSVSFGLRMKI